MLRPVLGAENKPLLVQKKNNSGSEEREVKMQPINHSKRNQDIIQTSQAVLSGRLNLAVTQPWPGVGLRAPCGSLPGYSVFL